MRRISKFSIFLIISWLFLFTIFQTTDRVYGQEDEQIEINDLEYQMYEYAEKVDHVNNTSSIEIDLPSNTWNVTKFEVNFTNIKLGKETKHFEESESGFKVLERTGNNYGYGVQFNISEPTILYGTYIYGFKNELAYRILSVQINGYNPSKNSPNETVYGNPIPLNITNNLGWHYQKFISPIDLAIGKYFLVVNGSNIFTAQDKFYLGYNSYGQYPNLYVSRYDGYTWGDGVKNSTLLYKLVQSTERMYNPQEINMTLEIDNIYYSVMNGNTNGTGYVKIPQIDYSSNQNPLKIPVGNNCSVILNFSYSYNLKMKNKFDVNGSAILKLNQEINWKVEPNIISKEINYSIRFFYPENWNDLKIYRNELDISSELDVEINTDDKYLYLENTSVITGAHYEITANSSQEMLDITFPILEFIPNQELRFSIGVPEVNGYVFWRLIDEWGFEEFFETKEVISEVTTLSFQIPQSPHEGDYRVIFCWYNNHKGSIALQSITITVPFTIAPEFIILMVLTVLIVVTASIALYITTKKVRNRIQQNRKRLVEKFTDVLSMKYFMVIDKESGLCVYEENFSGKKIDSTLISGFLDAIRSFGIELTGSYQESKIIRLEYKESKILMVEFKSFRLILIMKENPSDDFLNSITNLSYEIDDQYGHLLINFNHDVMPFVGINNLVQKHLHTTFLAPLIVVENKNLRLSSTERDEYQKALDFMKKNNMDYFFTSFLLSQHEYEPSKIKAIFSLIEKNIFQIYNEKGNKIPKFKAEINKN